MGVRSASAHVFINAKYWGIFDMVDGVDALFATDVFAEQLAATTTANAATWLVTPLTSVAWAPAPVFLALNLTDITQVTAARSLLSFEAVADIALMCFWAQNDNCLDEAVALSRSDGTMPSPQTHSNAQHLGFTHCGLNVC